MKIKIIVSAACLLIGCLILFIVPAYKLESSPTNTKQSLDLIDNQIRYDEVPRDLSDLHQSLEDYISKNVPGSSIYVEDLANSRSFTAGSDEPHLAMSLMKVPIVMSLYKAVELQRLDINEEQTITQQQINKEYGDLWRKGVGSRISLKAAAELALRTSDNTAINVINERVKSILLPHERAVNAIDLKMNTDPQTTITYITAESYTSVFRCLYYSCYITPAYSQHILDLLSKTDFNAPGKMLPSGTIISHKTGSAGQLGQSDCGIVYSPGASYGQCIMLKQGEPIASKHITTISKIIYDSFNKPN